MIKSWDTSKLREAVVQSECLADVCRILNIEIRGRTYDTLRNEISRQNIDTLHFKSPNQLRRERSINKNSYTKDELLRENSSPSSAKRFVKKNNLIPYVCSVCDLKPVWQNKELVLHFDHINGNHKDNRLENLRWLCPNCHSQTETYAGKKSYKKIKPSDLDPNWRKRPRIKQRKVDRPSKKELSSLLKANSKRSVGRMFGVSDTAITKWLNSR